MILAVENVVVLENDFDPPIPVKRCEATFNGVRIHDRMEVVVTGTSGGGVRYERLVGMIDTVFNDCFKLWPKDVENAPEGGKVWFAYDKIELIENATEESDLIR